MMSVSKLLLVTGLFLSVAFVHTASAGKLKLAHGITKSVEGCVIDCSAGQYHRHPTDCHKFIQCAPYGPQEMPCPATTVWDQSILTCNYEDAVACETGNYLTEDGKPCPDDGGVDDGGVTDGGVDDGGVDDGGADDGGVDDGGVDDGGDGDGDGDGDDDDDYDDDDSEDDSGSEEDDSSSKEDSSSSEEDSSEEDSSEEDSSEEDSSENRK